MADNRKRLLELMELYTKTLISKAEFDELCELLKEGNDDELKTLFETELRQAPFKAMGKQKLDRMLKEVLGERSEWSMVNSEREIPELVRNEKSGSLVHMFKRIAVAASILLVVGVGSYFLFFNKADKPDEIVTTTVPSDVKAPTSNRAMITLANGRNVSVDSLTSLKQDEVTVVKNANGEVIYKGSSTSQSITYNTLFNPRGSKVVSLTLSDGSKVWLNNESSLKYPIAFIGNERRVEITGEAYFEVAKDATKKFIVSGNGVTTEVLGTHFNVNAYEGESSIKVTLLEGSVRVQSSVVSRESVVIKPGQQAREVNGELSIVNNIDVDEVMAWKNGRFELNGTVQDIMKQIARWYDVEIVYIGNVTNKRFGGTLSREENVSAVLKYLELTGSIHFKIEGRKIMVMP